MQVTNRHRITQVHGMPNGFIDGRPSFSPDGSKIIFERQTSPQANAQLWVIDCATGSQEQLFYANPDYSCMRVDWSQNTATGKQCIAFTAQYPSDFNPKSRIMLLDPEQPENGAQWLRIKNWEFAAFSYPVWYRGTDTLMLANYSNNHLVKVNTQGEFLEVLTPDVFRSGMGCINQSQTSIIAFAGQPRTSHRYNQKINQIWIQLPGSDPQLFSSDASKAIGRAPWFNPDGSIMAFEAKGTNKRLQIFLKKVQAPYQGIASVQVSTAELYAQHAKFSPDGKYIVWAEQTATNCAQLVLAGVHKTT